MVPGLHMDPTSASPLYRQLSDQIRALIQSGRIGRGERLPPTRELAGTLGLNRATISAAYALLESEGLLRGHVGRGSFVDAPAPPARPLEWEQLLAPAAAYPPSLAPPEGEEIISFATSRPAERLFPVEEFRACCQEVASSRHARAILQLGSPHGYPPLRAYLLEEARRTGLARPGDDIVITNGCQQALDLIQRILIRPGDAVALEDPVYHGLRQVLSAAGARLVGVPVESDGISPEHFRILLEKDRPKLLVVTPNFQNPTGTTLPPAARAEILRAATRAGVVVVESDVYGDLRYEGTAAPSLKQMEGGRDVIHLRSYSKIAFPGLRVGWVIAPRAVTARLAEAKQWSDLHSDHLSQAVLLRFAESGRLEAHRRKVLAAGAARLAATLEACARELPAGSRWTRPQGGMNIWVRLPEPLDAAELLTRAHREKVTYLPGSWFAVSRPEPGALRLSFAGLSPERIRAGMAILGRLFSNERERLASARRLEPAPAMV